MTGATQDQVSAFLAAFADEVAERVAKKLQQGDPSELLTTGQVAAELGISARTARDLVNGRDGNPPRLASVRVGPNNGRRRVERAALDAYRAELRRAG